MTQENLFELFEHLAQEGFELKVETKDGKRYINVVTNLPNYNSTKVAKEYTEVSEDIANKVNASKNKRAYSTPYMTFIRAIRDKHPTLTNDKAKVVGAKFKTDYPDILTVSKKDFSDIISTVNFKYYMQ
jgi:hypothetical protein